MNIHVPTTKFLKETISSSIEAPYVSLQRTYPILYYHAEFSVYCYLYVFIHLMHMYISMNTRLLYCLQSGNMYPVHQKLAYVLKELKKN